MAADSGIISAIAESAARELGTSHQLLAHYVGGLDEWQQQERYRKAMREMEETVERAKAQERMTTPWEQERIRASCREALEAMLCLGFERTGRQAERGALDREQRKILGLFARKGFLRAQELLQKSRRR